jgi:hypothetical protein
MIMEIGGMVGVFGPPCIKTNARVLRLRDQLIAIGSALAPLKYAEDRKSLIPWLRRENAGEAS